MGKVIWVLVTETIKYFYSKILDKIGKSKEADKQRKYIEARDEVSDIKRDEELKDNVDKIIKDMEERMNKPLEERMKDLKKDIE